jgi:hypothetical protein
LFLETSDFDLDQASARLDEVISILDDFVMSESLAQRDMSLMIESFSRDDFLKLVRALKNFSDQLPGAMPSCRAAISKALRQIQVDYANTIGRGVSKREFAKHVAAADKLTKALINSLGELPGLLESLDQMLLASGTASEEDRFRPGGTTLGDSLPDEAKKVLLARIKADFRGKKVQSFWDSWFGEAEPTSYYGLTPDTMLEDILSLNKPALLRLFASNVEVKEIVDRIFLDPDRSENVEPARRVSRSMIDEPVSSDANFRDDSVSVEDAEKVKQAKKDKAKKDKAKKEMSESAKFIDSDGHHVIRHWRKLAGII